MEKNGELTVTWTQIGETTLGIGRWQYARSILAQGPLGQTKLIEPIKGFDLNSMTITYDLKSANVEKGWFFFIPPASFANILFFDGFGSELGDYVITFENEIAFKYETTRIN